MVAQQNQIRHASDEVSKMLDEEGDYCSIDQSKIDLLIKASWRVANNGAIRWVENLLRFRLMISLVESFSFSSTTAVPPISFKISSLNQVVFRFL